MQSRTKKSRSTKQSSVPKRKVPDARDYPAVIVWSDEDACFVASVPSLPGCMSHGNTTDEAARNILDAATGWLETAVEHDDHVPPPPRGMSGKLLVRVPKSLHEDIAKRADIDGVSINQWVVAALAKAAA